jgi:signal transduction histidine kinase
VRKERVTLEAVVKTAVETSRSFIETSGHELTVTFPPEPVVLDADPVRLAQVLNLLNNAAKFTEAGGRIWLIGEISIENPPVPTLHKRVVVIRVRDTGIGIPAVLLPRIFAMFTQADRSLERSRGGLGLGLTRARSLVQMYGGTIEAHSAGPGQGSEFVVRLPRATEGLEARDAGAEEGSGQEIAGSPRRRILVVDDDRDEPGVRRCS